MRQHSTASAAVVLAAAVALAVGALAGPVAAQERRVAYVEVRDQQGRPVTDLRAEEFQVAERVDGTPVPGRVVSALVGTGPMRVSLLVDNGEAMRAGQAENPMRDALVAFLETLPPRHHVGLFAIGGQVRELEDYTTDRGRLIQAARRLFTDESDGVRFVDSIRESLDRRYDEDEAWPVFVALLTDSAEASAFLNDRRRRRFVQSLVDSGAMVHVVQWNSGFQRRLNPGFEVGEFGQNQTGSRFEPRGRRSLVAANAGGQGTSATHTLGLNLTEVTGGRHISVAAGTGMEEAMRTLAEELGEHYERMSTRYVLTYQRPDPPGQGVMMRVTRPAVALRMFRNRAVEER